MTPALDAASVGVRFGVVAANHDVDLVVRPGELVGLIGPNGAGKTTLIDAITGFVPATGRISLAGEEIQDLSAARRARAGLVRTWQSVELFDDLTVADNLAVAGARPAPFDLLRDLLGRPRRVPHNAIERALGLVGLADTRDRFPDELSHGQRKLIGVARALMVDSVLLCLDEPAAGLDAGESRALGARLRQLADEGTTQLLVDHDMSLVLGVCDRVYVLDQGRVIASGTPAEIRSDPAVREAYLGTSAEEAS